MDINHFRESAGHFLQERAEMMYRYIAGLSARYDLGTAYERWGEKLFSDQSVHELMAQVVSCDDMTQKRGVARLAHFSLMGNLSRRVQDLDTLIASSRHDPAADGSHETSLQIALANEKLVESRKRAWGLLEECRRRRTNLVTRRLSLMRRGIQELTGGGYSRWAHTLTGMDLRAMRVQLEEFLRSSHDYHESIMEHCASYLVRRSREELEPWDFDHLLRGSTFDGAFGAMTALSLLKRTLMGMGFDLKKESGLVIDSEDRPGKSVEPRSIWCRVPEKVYLVLRPQGGLFDVRALFREAGRALMGVYTSADEPLESRQLGDDAVSIAFGQLFEGIVVNPEWLTDYVQLDDVDEFVSFMKFRKIHMLRTLSLRFLTESSYYEDATIPEIALGRQLADSYCEQAFSRRSPAECLEELSDPFLTIASVRAWIVEAELREILSERFGIRWYSRPGAGDVVRDLWGSGGGRTVEEIVHEVRGLRLHLDPMTREFS